MWAQKSSKTRPRKSVPLYVYTGSSPSSPLPRKSRYNFASSGEKTVRNPQKRFGWATLFQQATRRDDSIHGTRGRDAIGSPWSGRSASSKGSRFSHSGGHKSVHWSEFHKRFHSVPRRRKMQRMHCLSWSISSEQVYNHHGFQKRKKRRWFAMPPWFRDRSS